MRRAAVILFAGAFVIMLAPLSVRAEPVTFRWKAVITDLAGQPELIGGPVVGETFGGTFTYDPMIPPTFTGPDYLIFDGEPFAVSVMLGSLYLNRTGLGIVPGRGVLWQAQDGLEVGFAFGRPFPQFALPTPEELLASFDSSRARAWVIREDMEGPVEAIVSGNLTGLSLADPPTPIPEPGTLLLVGPAALLLRTLKRAQRGDGIVGVDPQEAS